MSSRKEDPVSGVPNVGVGFERELRNRSLGRGPADRDQVMYQCGYAAGLASAAKQPTKKIAQWRLLSAAASILAIASLASHFVLVPTDPPSKPVAEVTPRASDSAPQAKSDVWLTALTRGPATNTRAREGMTTVRALDSESASGHQSIFSLDWHDSIQSDLQPSDFTNFLNGDA